MAICATFDSVGLPSAFYAEDVNDTIPAEAIEITDAQWQDFLANPGLRKWQDGDVVEYTPPIPTPPVPDRVSARQFGLQLISAGIKDSVDTWIATQGAGAQWAYERSATFVRDDPMMQSGFTALGFTSEQIDAFFTAAAAL